MHPHREPWAPEAPALDDPPDLRRLPGPGRVLYANYRPILFLAEVEGAPVLATLVDEAEAPDGTVTSAYVAVPIEEDEAQAVIGSRMSVRDAFALRPCWAFHETRRDDRPGPGLAWEGTEPPLDLIAAPGAYLSPDGAAA